MLENLTYSCQKGSCMSVSYIRCSLLTLTFFLTQQIQSLLNNRLCLGFLFGVYKVLGKQMTATTATTSIAIIGHTGFVGQHLREAWPRAHLFNSKNIETIRNRHFDTVYCCGVYAKKWIANQHPEADSEQIKRLVDDLETIQCKCFVLISTIDVYDTSDASKVASGNSEQPMSSEPYGRHRYELEEWARCKFNAFIVRLPALFGLGLSKNALFDLQHEHRLEFINGADSFQWYDLSRLAADIATSLEKNMRITDLFPAPIEMQVIVDRFFPHLRDRIQRNEDEARHYRIESHTCPSFDAFDVLGAMEKYLNLQRRVEQSRACARLAVSSMAWDACDHDYAMFVLDRYGIENVEIVLTKYGPWRMDTAIRLRQRLDDAKKRCCSMQSVFYGVDCQLGSDEATEHMELVHECARVLGARFIVCGSPKLRAECSVNDLLLTWAQSGNEEPFNCLEHCAEAYGCRVGSTVEQCNAICQRSKDWNRHLFINFDTGNARLENLENLENLTNAQSAQSAQSEFIRHAQVSAPHLRALNRDDVEHAMQYKDILKSTEFLTLECRVPIEELASQCRLFVDNFAM